MNFYCFLSTFSLLINDFLEYFYYLDVLLKVCVLET
jgi:hypothetical protein